MTPAVAHDTEAVFSRRGWLAHQPADFQRSVLASALVLNVAPGQTIFSEGDERGGIHGVLKGSIACEVTTQLAGPSLVHIMQPGWWFGQGPALFDRRRTMSFRAVEHSEVLRVSLSAIRALGAEEPETFRRIGQLAELSAMLAIEGGCELLIHDARQRIAAVLLRVTAVLEGVVPDTPRGYRITQTQLAEMSNVSRHHTNVALLELQAKGYVALDYGRIAVLAPERLAQFARTIEASARRR